MIQEELSILYDVVLSIAIGLRNLISSQERPSSEISFFFPILLLSEARYFFAEFRLTRSFFLKSCFRGIGGKFNLRSNLYKSVGAKRAYR